MTGNNLLLLFGVVVVVCRERGLAVGRCRPQDGRNKGTSDGDGDGDGECLKQVALSSRSFRCCSPSFTAVDATTRHHKTQRRRHTLTHTLSLTQTDRQTS